MVFKRLKTKVVGVAERVGFVLRAAREMKILAQNASVESLKCDKN
jgi:hypothetical protein